MPSAPIHSRSSPPKDVQEALSRLPDSAWIPVEVTKDYVVYETVIDIAGKMTIAQKTEYLADDLLQKANKQEYDDSHGKRWGDGKVVARIPMNMIFGQSQIAEKLREGDNDHMRWWLNNPANAPFRTFKGRV